MSLELTLAVWGTIGAVTAAGQAARKHSPPIACSRDALAPAEREQHARLSTAIAAAARGVEELADGYALRLPATREAFADVSAWVGLERLCCPFLDFTLELKAGREQLLLRLTGPEGTKAVLAAGLEGLR